MGMSDAAINEALDGVTMDLVSLHNGDPGTTGENIIAGGGKKAATFGAASNKERVLQSDVTFDGLGAGADVTHFGVWEDNGNGGIFKWGRPLTGDQKANASGEYTLLASGTKLTGSEAS